MAKPTEFTINGVKFYASHDKDTHGTEAHYYAIDDKSVNYGVFWRKIVQVIKDTGGLRYVNNALSHYQFSLEDK